MDTNPITNIQSWFCVSIRISWDVPVFLIKIMTSLGLISEERKDVKSNNVSSNSLEHLCILKKKRTLHPLLNTSKMSISYNNTRSHHDDRHIARRILSAKDHRLKQLQNQLSDAHYHLNELTNENRLLRNLQKRMDSALQRYEGVNGDIPKIFNSHNEEIRSWQSRFKQIKSQLKETSQKLKNKEIEFQQLSDEHKHLLNLSKDTKLCEREKLQQEVNELREKLEKQNETINNLQKKLHFENKSHKQQLNGEIRKHKETQSKLNNALLECEQLHLIIDEKESTIKSMSIKKSPKINNPNIEKNVTRKEFDNDAFYLNLTDNGKSTSDSHVTISSDSFNKTENQSNFTFTISENKAQNENDTSSDSNATKTLKNHESEKEQLSDSVKKRVDLMKAQLSQSSKSKRLPKSKIKNTFRSNSDSSQDDAASSATSNKNSKDQLPFLNSQKRIVDDDDEYVDNDYIKSLSYFDANSIDKKCQELEEDAARERFMVETVLEDFTNDILRAPEETIKRSQLKTLKTVRSESFIENEKKSDNNNVRKTSNVSNLDEEKKKKLLATLKAIDRGDDDGLSIESIPKIRLGNRISKIN